jgi:hypothetical protein
MLLILQPDVFDPYINHRSPSGPPATARVPTTVTSSHSLGAISAMIAGRVGLHIDDVGGPTSCACSRAQYIFRGAKRPLDQSYKRVGYIQDYARSHATGIVRLATAAWAANLSYNTKWSRGVEDGRSKWVWVRRLQGPGLR